MMKRSLAAFAALALAAATLAACSQEGSNSANGDEFKMGLQPWLGYGPWYIANDQGYSKKHEVNLKLSNFNTDDQVTSALVGRKLDGASVATHTALKLIEAGAPVSIVMLEDVSTTADAIAAVGVDDVAGLRGKRVAYEEGTTSDILLQSALAANGMSSEDVTKVPLPASDAGGALLAGRVPVAVTYEPYLTEAVKNDRKVKLIYTAGEEPGIISDVLVVRNDIIKDNPQKVQGLVDTWFDSINYYKTNTPDGQAIISKGVGAEVSDLKTAFEGVEYYGKAENQTGLSGQFTTKTLKDVFDAAKVAGILDGTIELDKVVDPQFVK